MQRNVSASVRSADTAGAPRPLAEKAMRGIGAMVLTWGLITTVQAAPPKPGSAGDFLFNGQPLAHWIGAIKEHRREAFDFVNGVGPKHKAIVPRLECLLEDPDPWVRALTIVALGNIGPEAAPALPAIARRLSDGWNI